MRLKMILSALIIFAFTGMSSAQNPQQRRAGFVDADNNGICDNYENGTCGRGGGQGIMDGSGRGCVNFIDADGNGICDNCENRTCESVCGGTCGGGRSNMNAGNRRPKGNFIDENNNGICDRRETINGK